MDINLLSLESRFTLFLNGATLVGNLFKRSARIKVAPLNNQSHSFSFFSSGMPTNQAADWQHPWKWVGLQRSASFCCENIRVTNKILPPVTTQELPVGFGWIYSHNGLDCFMVSQTGLWDCIPFFNQHLSQVCSKFAAIVAVGHSGRNSSAQLFPQVFTGVEVRTAGGPFHSLHCHIRMRHLCCTSLCWGPGGCSFGLRL